MKIFICFLLCLSVVTSNVYARRVVKKFDLLQDATRKMFEIPKFTANMAWGKSGVAMDELITYLHNYDFNTYRQYKSERGLRRQLGKVIKEEMQSDVFSLQIQEDGKQVSKYFRGTAPDLKAIIADIVATDALSAKMQWGKEGLSMDDIIAEVSTHHPEVRELYVGFSHNNKESGLRTALGMVLEKQMKGGVFSLQIQEDGKNVSKYFRGTAPDLKAIIADIVATDAFSAKMQWGEEGLSMDDIMAEVSTHHPEVRELYVGFSHNNKESGLRIALGKVLDAEMQGDVFSLLIQEDGKNVSKYFRGTAPDLKAIIADIVATDAFSAKMQWGEEGLSMDDIMAEVSTHHPEVRELYVGFSHNNKEHGLRTALGMVLEKQMKGGVFSLLIQEDGKKVSKSFRGTAPDLKAIIADILATDALSAKMQWGEEGLSMDDIMAEVSTHHPEVRELYVGFSHNNKESGLRSALGMVLEKQMKGGVFSLQIQEDGKNVSKYFRGTAPDLKAIIADIVATDAFSAKMQWGEEGLSMDDIMAKVSTHHPEVRELYVGFSHNNKEHGLRSALRMVLSSIDRVVLHDQRYFWKGKK